MTEGTSFSVRTLVLNRMSSDGNTMLYILIASGKYLHI